VSWPAPQGISPPNRSTILKYRLRYAEKGVPTSPADTERKKPHLTGWQRKATTSPQQIIAESNRWPDAGILTPTGARYGRFVLDEDTPGELARLEEDLGVKLLGVSTEVRTPSSLLHVHLLWPEGADIRNSVGKNASDDFEGIDVRAEGGLVMLPPTPGYNFSNDLPMAQAPPELVEWATSRNKAAPAPNAARSKTNVAPLSEGETIPKGARHNTLASILGGKHDGTRSLSELTELALHINERQCDPPIGSPGDDDPIEDVVRTAKSIHGKTPCRPAARRDDEPTMRALLAFEKRMEATKWRGHARNRLSLLKTYVLQARRYGELREDGSVAISISNMQAALANGISDRSVRRNNVKLSDERWIHLDNEDRRPEEAGTVVLLTSAHSVLTHNNSLFSKEKEGVGSLGHFVSGAKWSAPRARHGRPVWEGGEYVAFLSRMGKGAEAGVDLLEQAGGRMHYTTLASEMGIKRARSLFRAGGWLWKLEDAGVVEFASETGEISLTASWLEAWNVRREQDGEIEDYHRDVKAYERRRSAWRDHLKESCEERRKLVALKCAAEDEQCRALLNEMDEEHELIRDVTHLVEVEPDGARTGESTPSEPGVSERPDGEPEEPEGPELSELVIALRNFLALCPHRCHERPSWLANYAWSEELVGWKPTECEVVAALNELAHNREEAA
jgi:hypothetical protein